MAQNELGIFTPKNGVQPTEGLFNPGDLQQLVRGEITIGHFDPCIFDRDLEAQISKSLPDLTGIPLFIGVRAGHKEALMNTSLVIDDSADIASKIRELAEKMIRYGGANDRIVENLFPEQMDVQIFPPQNSEIRLPSSTGTK